MVSKAGGISRGIERPSHPGPDLPFQGFDPLTMCLVQASDPLFGRPTGSPFGFEAG